MNQPAFYTNWLEKRSQLTPNKLALVDKNNQKRFTFYEWNNRVNQTANFLKNIGIKKGDLVSVYSSNNVEYMDLFFACGKMGAIIHNLNWRLTVNELTDIIQTSKPKIIFYSKEWENNIDEIKNNYSPLFSYCLMWEPSTSTELTLHSRKECSPCYTPMTNPPGQDDPWGIYYTGGTTGLPKGAVLTHGNMVWNSINTISSWGVNESDIAPLQLPFFHVGGPNIFMMPLVHVGGTTLLCEQFDVEETFDMIEDGLITLYVGVPTMFIMLQQHPRWNVVDFSKLKLIISGGAPCPLPVMQKFWDKGVDFKMGYGLTEASGNNFWLPQKDVQKKPGSVGFPIFHVEMKIIRESGKECDQNEEGELLIKGPHISPGYWENPDATKEIIKDGWLHTGDIARMDSDGYYTIVGRKKEMFISGGENVYPAEIESILHDHPDIIDAVVLGQGDQKWGEIGVAFISLQSNSDLTEDSLLNFLSDKLAKYKIPKVFHFLEFIPKTAIGKIDKIKLINTYLVEG